MEKTAHNPTLYCEVLSGLPAYGDLMCAVDGFGYLDYNIKTYGFLSDVVTNPSFINKAKGGDVVIGGVMAMRKHFQALRCLPPSIDYPEIIAPSISGRETELKTLAEVEISYTGNNSELFVKPVFTKLRGFDAKPYRKEEIRGLIQQHDSTTPVYVSPVDIYESEHRVFIHRGLIVDIKRYRGHFSSTPPDLGVIQEMVSAYEKAPVSYAMDIAVNQTGKTVLVEINDFWAIGSYGLDSVLYATMLRDRYQEIVDSGYNVW